MMSDAVFPVLKGLEWNRTKVPMWSTMIQTSISGVEKRASLWSYPRWKFGLSYEFLDDDGTGAGDLQQIIGFFNARRGAFDDFLYEDPTDNHVTGQSIGAGNGAAKEFQLVRSYGGFAEPIRAVKGIPLVKINGEAVSQFEVNNTGLITFDNPPQGVITATFDFYYRVRFLEDEAEFNNFIYKLWELKKLELISLKGRE